MNRRSLTIALWALLILFLAACGSDADQAQGAVDQASVVAVVPTPVPTTAPLAVPTATATPLPTAVPAPLPTALPTPLPTPTVAAATPVPTATVEQDPTTAADPTAVAGPAPDPTAVPTATVGAEVIETPTLVPTAIAAEPEAEETPTVAEETPTAAAETPTPAAAVASGEPPIECFDRDLGFPRAYIEGVDNLSFDGGTVYCTGSARDAVSVARSYRHANGLVIQRNADFIFNDTSGTYIPYSGSVHFCLNGQPGSTPVRADSVPALLVVIDNEAQRQVASGASAPAAFTGSGAQC